MSDRTPNSNVEAGIWIYLWDLIDEGIDETLDSLAARGFSRLHIAVLYHAARCLLPHNPRRTVFTAEGGTAYYKPRGAYGRLRPIVSELVGTDDPLALVVESAHQRGFKVTAWMTPGHDLPLAPSDLECATVNAFGDRNSAILCPAHPDVREYAVNCVVDLLEHYAFDGVQIETMDYWGFVHDAHHEKIGLSLSSRAHWLLSLCFCPACMARAQKIDADRFRGSVTRYLKSYLDSGPERDLDRIAEEDLIAYQEQRCGSVCDAVEQIRFETSKRALPLEYIIAPDLEWMRHAGIDLVSLAKSIDGVALMAYRETVAEVAAALESMRSFACTNGATICLQACHPYLRQAGQASELVDMCVRLGHRKISFYNFGLAPNSALDWIANALGAANRMGQRNS